MKFSIIVPVYNVKDYLAECLQSVLSQNFQDYELILVDDGSTDGSGVLCDDYASKYPQVKVVHRENGGLSAARNSGVQESQGDYLIFLDSDDWWLGDFLGKVAERATGDVMMFDVQEVTPTGNKHLELTKGLADSYATGEEFFLAALRLNPYYRWYAWMYAYRREFWLQNGFAYPEGYSYEDTGTTYKVLLAAKQVSVLHEEVYAYRRSRAGSITSDLKGKVILDWLELVMKMVQDVKGRKIPTELKERIYASAAFTYFGLLIQVNRVANKAEQEQVYRQLRVNKSIAHYAAPYSKKYRVSSILLSILGVKGLSKLLGLRMKAKS